VKSAKAGKAEKIGTLFVVGDSEEVLKHSRSLILDPLFGHPDALKVIHLPDMRETVKELAQLDGAFVVSDAGGVVSESSIVRVFDDGEIISEIIPELWMFARYSTHLAGQVSELKEEDLTIVSKAE
jgi:DNA integrity scanning protein DisA with diadenylate cyclase activity